jgi:hypothetical protein
VTVPEFYGDIGFREYAPGEKKMCDVVGHDKVYSPDAVVLSTLPPVSLCKWICGRCGATGTDRQEIKQDNEYEQLKKRFAKKEQK